MECLVLAPPWVNQGILTLYCRFTAINQDIYIKDIKPTNIFVLHLKQTKNGKKKGKIYLNFSMSVISPADIVTV